MQDRAQDRYTGVAKALHWIIAALILANIGLAWQMEGPRGPNTFAIVQLHKSIGITVLLLTLVRIGWRVANPPPPLSPHLAGWERALAHAVHWAFYAIMLLMPLTGWLMVSSSKLPVPTMLYGLVHWPHLPVGAGMHQPAESAHAALAFLTYALVLLHVAGALKHQWVDRDGELGRMLPGPRRSGPLDPRLAAVAVAFVAICVGVKLYPWNRPAPATFPVVGEPAEAPVTPPPPAEAAAKALAANTPSAKQQVAADDPKPAAEAARWTVDKARSSLGFRATWNGAAVVGSFPTWDADIRFDPEALDSSSVKATVTLSAVASDNNEAKDALPGSDFFDAATHPKATFTATRFKALGGGRFEAAGTLSLRGSTHPLTLRFTPGIAGDSATMKGTATLQRTRFGVGQGGWAATDQIADAVEVTVAIRATRGK